MLGGDPARQGDRVGGLQTVNAHSSPQGYASKGWVSQILKIYRFPLKLLEKSETFMITLWPLTKEKQLLLHPEFYYGAFFWGEKFSLAPGYQDALSFPVLHTCC